MLVLARHDANLFDLDLLIRDVWVECCDHLSAFTIHGQRFSSYTDDGGPGLSVPLDHVIGPGSSFSYEYDFGSTTKLRLSVVGQSPVAPLKRPLCLIARNSRPEIPCRVCGKEGEYLATNWRKSPVPVILCRDCVRKKSDELDPECVVVIPNSPRCGVCGYVEDPITALRWYPAGWCVEDIYPAKSEEVLEEIMNSNEDAGGSLSNNDARVSHTPDTGGADLNKEISVFINDEILEHGPEHGAHAVFIVNEFVSNMCEQHKRKVSEWDIGSVRTCLLKDMAVTRDIISEGSQEVVPIICRFLLHLQESGLLPDATGMIKALLAAEPAFEAVVATNENEVDLFVRVVTDLYHQKVVAKGDGRTNPFDKSVSTTIVTNEATIRKTMIRLRCEEFCERFSDNTVSECCTNLVTDLASHPESPLLRGDLMLWSAAIVYTACKRENLFRRGTAGSQLGEEIALFFAISLSSMRSKASAIKKYLTPTDPRGD